MLAGCATDRAVNVATQNPSEAATGSSQQQQDLVPQVATTMATQSSDWLNKSDEIRQNKKTGEAAKLYGSLANGGDYAYRSDPVDINGPGRYALKFKIAGDFNPLAFTFMSPPDAAFVHSFEPPADPKVGADGTYVVMLVVPATEKAFYPGFSVWIY